MPADSSGPPDFLSYSLRFPAELDVRQVTAWLQALSGLLPGAFGRGGAPIVAVELWATAQYGFRYRLVVPPTHAGYVVRQLRTALPGVHVTPDEATEAPSWTVVVELGMRRGDRGLRVEPVALAASVLASLQGHGLRQREVLLLQWIFRPAVPVRPPRVKRSLRLGPYAALQSPGAPKDVIADQRTKLESVNFLGVVRIGVQADDAARAKHLLAGVRTAFRSAGTASNSLYERALPGSTSESLGEYPATLLVPAATHGR